MENLASRTITLKVRIQYTDENVQKLRAKFKRFHGVDKVEVDRQRGLFRIIGRADPQMLIQYLESRNIKSELHMYEIYSHTEFDSLKNPKPEKSTFRKPETADNLGRTASETNQRERSAAADDNGRDARYREKEKRGRKPKKDAHVCEPYEPVKIDPLFCRDPYCMLHKSRPFVNSKVPSIHSEDHPRHMHGHGHGHDHGQFFPGATGIGNQPLMYGGGHIPIPMMPPYSSFGFPPARNHVPGPRDFGFYGHPPVNFRGPFM